MELQVLSRSREAHLTRAACVVVRTHGPLWQAPPPPAQLAGPQRGREAPGPAPSGPATGPATGAPGARPASPPPSPEPGTLTCSRAHVPAHEPGTLTCAPRRDAVGPGGAGQGAAGGTAPWPSREPPSRAGPGAAAEPEPLACLLAPGRRVGLLLDSRRDTWGLQPGGRLVLLPPYRLLRPAGQGGGGGGGLAEPVLLGFVARKVYGA